VTVVVKSCYMQHPFVDGSLKDMLTSPLIVPRVSNSSSSTAKLHQSMADLSAVQPDSTPRWGPTWPWLLLFLVVGTALRMYMLGVKSLWLDEAFSVEVARMPLPAFLRTVWWGEANMTLYYVFLRFWIHLGDSELWLRCLSAVVGVLTIAATYAFGKTFLNRRAGLAAAALLALHSYHIRYSQELRAYTLVTLLVVLSTYAFLRLLEAPDRKVFWILYAFLIALAVYAQVLAVFVLLSQWLVLTPRRIKQLGVFKLLSLGASIALLIAPIAAVMVLQNKGQLDWVPRPNLTRVLDVMQDMAGAQTIGSHSTASGLLLSAFYATTWIIAFSTLCRVRPSQPNGQMTKTALQVLAIGFIFPIAAMTAVSFLKPIMVPRYLLMCVPAAVMLAGYGLVTLDQWLLKRRIISWAVLVTMLAMASFSVRDYYASFKTYGHDWRGVTHFLLSQEQSGDAAVFYTFSGHRAFDYYVQREQEAGAREAAMPVLFPLELAQASIQKRTAPYHRVWLVLHQTIPTALTNSQSQLIRSALQERFRLASEREFPGDSATRDETGTIWVGLYVERSSSPEQ
jgi:mannosyltransferase